MCAHTNIHTYTHIRTYTHAPHATLHYTLQTYTHIHIDTCATHIHAHSHMYSLNYLLLVLEKLFYIYPFLLLSDTVDEL